MTNPLPNSLQLRCDPNDEYLSEVHLAVSNRQYDRLTDLLKTKQPNSNKDGTKYTPLHLAAQLGDVKATKILLDAGYDPNAVNERILFRGLDSSNPQDISNVFKLESETPLTLAVERKHKDVALLLIEAGGRALDAARYALSCDDDDNDMMFAFLLDHIEFLEERDDDGVSLAQLAVTSKRNTALRLLLERGIDPNTPGNRGFTALHWAVWYRNLEAADMLLNRGCEVNVADDQGCTAVHHGAYKVAYKRPEITDTDPVELLLIVLRFGATPNVTNDKGLLPLQIIAGEHTLLASVEDTYFEISEDSAEWLLLFGSKYEGKDFDLLANERSRIAEIIVELNVKKQLAKLEFDGVTKMSTREYPSEDFRGRCLAELEKMKLDKSLGRVTMYEYLHGSKFKLVSLSTNEDVKKVFQEAGYKSQYPLYNKLLEYNFYVGTMYEPYYHRAYDCLSIAFKTNVRIALERMLDFIDKETMKNLIEAFEE